MPIVLKDWSPGGKSISFTDEGLWVAGSGTSAHTVKIDLWTRATGGRLQPLGDAKPRKIKIGNDEYTLSQFHFHLPSEHVVDDGRYENRHQMEMHLVFTRPDNTVGAVVAVFLWVDNGIIDPRTGNPRASRVGQLESFLELFPPATARAAGGVGENGRLMELLLPPVGQRSYITYSGSLTTPKCDSGVTWIVMTRPVGVSPEFYNEFKRRFPMNARWPQRVNDRRLESGTIGGSQAR